MPRERLERQRPPFIEWLGRACLVFLLSMAGTAVVGEVYAIAWMIHVRIVESEMRFDDVAMVIVTAPMCGCLIGTLLFPLPLIFVLRKPIARSMRRIYGCTCAAALAAICGPTIGLIVVALVFVAMCIESLRRPTVWPELVPPGRCAGCGYNLRGLDGASCPECGRNIPQPRECRACYRPLPTPDQSAPEWNRGIVSCQNCSNTFEWALSCQRCGHHLPPDAAACPGCHRPTGLPAKS